MTFEAALSYFAVQVRALLFLHSAERTQSFTGLIHGDQSARKGKWKNTKPPYILHWGVIRLYHSMPDNVHLEGFCRVAPPTETPQWHKLSGALHKHSPLQAKTLRPARYSNEQACLPRAILTSQDLSTVE